MSVVRLDTPSRPCWLPDSRKGWIEVGLTLHFPRWSRLESGTDPLEVATKTSYEPSTLMGTAYILYISIVL